jgi:hypothetical protein
MSGLAFPAFLFSTCLGELQSGMTLAGGSLELPHRFPLEYDPLSDSPTLNSIPPYRR